MKEFFKKVGTLFVNFLNADKTVQIRTVAFFTSLIAMFAKTVFKKDFEFDPETITELIISFGVIVLGLRSWWKDNPNTPEAKAANEYMHTLKQTVFEEVTDDEFITESEG